MSNRLPIPGGDQGDWGAILNDFLSVSLYNNPSDPNNGSLNANTVGAAQIKAGAISISHLDDEAQSIINSVSDKYIKPSSGVPNSDMENDVQTSLGLANSALQASSNLSGGDLSGTVGSPIVARINGVSLPSDAGSSGQVLVAIGADGAAWTTGGSSVTIDNVGGDIQPLGSASAGNKGQAADAKHVHSMPRLDQLSAPTAAVSMAGNKITNLSNGSAGGDMAAFGQIPVAGTTAGTYSVGNDSRITGALQSTNDLNDLNSVGSARTNLGLGSGATATAGGANGIAELDSSGNVEVGQLGNVTANFRHRGQWSSTNNLTYVLNDAVTNNGGFYVCINSYTPTANSSFDGITGGNWTVLTGKDAYVDDFGGDPTGAIDSTAAYNAALASLPTIVIYQNEGASSPPSPEGGGNSFTVAVGTVIFSAGTYTVNNTAINGLVGMNTSGPYVTVKGKGKYLTTLMDYSQQVTMTCTTTSGTGHITTTGNFITAGILPFMLISGTNIQPCYVFATGIKANSLNMSVPATVSETVSLTFNSFIATANNGSGYPVVNGGGDFYAGTQWTGASWRELTIDGYNAGQGANGLFLFCGEDPTVQDFTAQNYTGGNGLTLADAYWIEGWNIRMSSVNNLNGVVFMGRPEGTPVSQGGTAGNYNSNSQGNLELHVQANPGQTGVAMINGAWVYHSRIVIRGSFYTGATGGGKVLNVEDAHTSIDTTELKIAVECDAGPTGTAAKPTTIKLDTNNAARIVNCFGSLSFRNLSASFNPINYTGAAELFTFCGLIAGDTTLTQAGSASNTRGNPTFLSSSTTMYS